MSTTAGKCTGTDLDTGKPCECLQYSEATHLDPEKPVKCRECFHGRSLHKQDSVNDILRGLLGPGGPSLLDVNTSPVKAARQESNEGYTGGRAGSSATEVAKASVKSAKNKSKVKDEKPFGVLAVILNPSGVYYDDVAEKYFVSENTVIAKPQYGDLVSQGLASVNREDGIKFVKAWDADHIEKKFKELLPKAFEYITSQQSEGPSWYLGRRDKKRVEVAMNIDGSGPVVRPTGSDLEWNKGSSKSGWKESVIWIVTKDEVPQDVLNTWQEGQSLEGPALGKGKNKRAVSVLSGHDSAESSDDDSVQEIPPKKALKRMETMVGSSKVIDVDSTVSNELQKSVDVPVTPSSTRVLRPRARPRPTAPSFDITFHDDVGQETQDLPVADPDWLEMDYEPMSWRRASTPPQPTVPVDPKYSAESDGPDPWKGGNRSFDLDK